MDQQPNNIVELDESFSLRDFFLAAVLWLPLAFFLWFLLRTVVVYPVVRIAGLALQWLLPELVTSSEQMMSNMEVITTLPAPGYEAEVARNAVLVMQVPVMIYAYSLPLLMGLVMATPLTVRQRLLQLSVGAGILVLAQSFGVMGDALKQLAFDLGPRALAHTLDAGFSQTAIALWYQFGYLMMPALSPIFIWAAFNRRALDAIWGEKHNQAKEPDSAVQGHKASNSSQSEQPHE